MNTEKKALATIYLVHTDSGGTFVPDAVGAPCFHLDQTSARGGNYYRRVQAEMYISYPATSSLQPSASKVETGCSSRDTNSTAVVAGHLSYAARLAMFSASPTHNPTLRRGNVRTRLLLSRALRMARTLAAASIAMYRWHGGVVLSVIRKQQCLSYWLL